MKPIESEIFYYFPRQIINELIKNDESGVFAGIWLNAIYQKSGNGGEPTIHCGLLIVSEGNQNSSYLGYKTRDGIVTAVPLFCPVKVEKDKVVSDYQRWDLTSPIVDRKLIAEELIAKQLN